VHHRDAASSVPASRRDGDDQGERARHAGRGAVEGFALRRASDALLAFSAGRLRTDPARALLADVRVGEAPVGLALAKQGSLIVVADSDRFGASAKSASLSVVGVPAARAGRPALLGYLPAGQFPRDVAAGPGGSTMLVANYDSGQIETVNPGALP
jgi:hypothetical protein